MVRAVFRVLGLVFRLRGRQASCTAIRVSPSRHDLARADFAGFTRFDPTVDGHRAVRDHHFCGPATVGEPRYLQKIVQFDVVAGQCEIEVGHGVCALKQRVRIISQKLVLNESPVGLDLALAIASSCYVMLYFCQKNETFRNTGRT